MTSATSHRPPMGAHTRVSRAALCAASWSPVAANGAKSTACLAIEQIRSYAPSVPDVRPLLAWWAQLNQMEVMSMAGDRYPELGTAGLLARWDAWSAHDTWTRMLAKFTAEGNEKHAAGARDALTGMEAVSPLDALAANEELTRLMTGWRWLAMRDARESGATWEQIGESLGMTRQGAKAAYLSTVENQERYCPDYFTEADSKAHRALLDDGTPSCPGSGRPWGSGAGSPTCPDCYYGPRGLGVAKPRRYKGRWAGLVP